MQTQITDKDWWKTNKFGIPSEIWIRLVKLLSHGEYETLFGLILLSLDDKAEEIIHELHICEIGRYGYTRSGAEEFASFDLSLLNSIDNKINKKHKDINEVPFLPSCSDE